mgnify:FL=1
MRALGNVARAGIAILGFYLMSLLVAAPRWASGGVEMTSPTALFADALMVDWSFSLVILGALLAMAMIGASYLVRDERLENLIWNEGGVVISAPPSKRSSVSVTMDSPSGNELQKLADYLVESGQTVFDFFRSIDLDDSGEIDTMEFQLALKNASIGNLPPWDIDALVSQMDLNSDGKLDLPELDIALTSLISNENKDSVKETEAEVVEIKADDEAEKEAAEHQKRLEKELEARRKNLENLDEKARKKQEELIRVAEKAKTIDFGTLGIASASDADDLQKIKGIGPFIAEKLNALGIYKFSQLANMTSEIEEEVNVAIEFFPGRVKRDEWAKQASTFIGGEEE